MDIVLLVVFLLVIGAAVHIFEVDARFVKMIVVIVGLFVLMCILNAMGYIDGPRGFRFGR